MKKVVGVLFILLGLVALLMFGLLVIYAVKAGINSVVAVGVPVFGIMGMAVMIMGIKRLRPEK